MKYPNFIEHGVINIFIDAQIFSKNALLKCLYWYGDKFHTTVALENTSQYVILLEPFSETNVKEEELDFFLQKFERDIIDYQLREIIVQQTGNIRDLLVAKAFSNGEFDEDPPAEISDPMGFDPKKLTASR